MESIFDPEGLKQQLAELEAQLNDPLIWDDLQQSTLVTTKAKKIKKEIQEYDYLQTELVMLAEMTDLFNEEDEQQVITAVEELEQKINSLEILTLLSGKHDRNDAIVTINAGAGGTDAQDWAEMLLRMYLRWGEKNGYDTQLIDTSAGDEAGIKSATIIFRGEYAYGYLSAESGIHRLVRISPFNANGKRQTSFASVEVIPEIEKDVTVEIKLEDLRIDTYRASGAGGQHINKTDSAVRITHLPSGIVVQCQNQRSQIQNKETALKILSSRLQLIEEQKQSESLQQYKDGKSISWGNQIRSYVFHPYSLVKDHRFSVETSDVQKVMDGDIIMFIDAFLKNKPVQGEVKG